MSRRLTASDRSALIRLASVLPVGSGERRAILESITSRSRRASSFDRNLVDAAVELVDKDWGPIEFGNLPFKVWTEIHNYGGHGWNERKWEIPESYDFDLELTLPSDIVSQVDPDDVEDFMGHVMDEFIRRTTPLGFVKELLNYRSSKSQGSMLDPIMDSIRPVGGTGRYHRAIDEFRVEGVREVSMYPKEGTLKKGPSSYSIEIECLIRGLDLLVVLDEAWVWD